MLLAQLFYSYCKLFRFKEKSEIRCEKFNALYFQNDTYIFGKTHIILICLSISKFFGSNPQTLYNCFFTRQESLSIYIVFSCLLISCYIHSILVVAGNILEFSCIALKFVATNPYQIFIEAGSNAYPYHHVFKRSESVNATEQERKQFLMHTY